MRFAAFVAAIAAAWYGDLSSPDPITRLVIPLGGVACLFLALGVRGAGLVLAAALCFRFTDVMSDTLFHSLVLPLLGTFFVLCFVVWAWQHDVASGSAGGDFGGDGGDFGGGDG